MKRALLVDDEKRMLDLLELYLRPHHYTSIKIQEADSVLTCLQTTTVDIVLLDIMMPKIDGWELCREIRNISDVPIIMVTAREQQEDIVKGLKIGADDYIVKPFDEEELLARMEALLRRRNPADRVEIDGLIWEGDCFELTYKSQQIKLTPKEFSMVGLLMKNPNKVFSREQLIDMVWGFHSETEGRTVDSHVRNMREKLRQAGFPVDEYVKTIWGVGYKWINGSIPPNK